jgi:transaldolase
MELWLDTINTGLIREACHLTQCYGVTTNPAILASDSSRDVRQIITDLLALDVRYVAIQVTEDFASKMLLQVERLKHYFGSEMDRLIIKVPAFDQGFSAIRQLGEQGIATMATVVFEPHQVWMACQQGARYIAPYYGKMGEHADSKMRTMQEIIHHNGNDTGLLAASIKNMDHIVFCAGLGCKAITLPDHVYSQMLGRTEAMDQAITHFNHIWRASGREQDSLWGTSSIDHQCLAEP